MVPTGQQKRAVTTSGCALQFNDEQGVPGHIVPVCLGIMDQGGAQGAADYHGRVMTARYLWKL